MDATRVMTTAALGVAMATLFAPPLGALVAGDRPRHEPKLTVATVATLPAPRTAAVCAPSAAVALAGQAAPSRLAQAAE